MYLVLEGRMTVRKLLGPGMWVDDEGEMHVSIPDLLEAFGWPDDDEHRATCERVVRQVICEQYPGIKVREVE